MNVRALVTATVLSLTLVLTSSTSYANHNQAQAYWAGVATGTVLGWGGSPVIPGCGWGGPCWQPPVQPWGWGAPVVVQPWRPGCAWSGYSGAWGRFPAPQPIRRPVCVNGWCR